MRMAIVFLCALAAEAFAHGGVFRGPNSGIPPGLGLMCECAAVDCKQCSAADLAAGPRLATRTVSVQRFQQSNDFAFVRCTAVFRSSQGKRPIEAFAALQPAALFAPTGGDILQGGVRLTAKRATSLDARRRYLWAKTRGLDPFLLLRQDPGRYSLRAFPVRNDYDTVVTVEGVALAPPRSRGGVRLYRTEGDWLAVRDLKAGEQPRPGEFHDTGGARALEFLTAADARGRYPKLVDKALQVTFVRELRRAVVGDATALVALPANAPLPPGSGHDPVDPPPPPPADPGPSK